MKLRYDAQGLAPAVVVHAATGEVLTVAYVNEASLQKTLDSQETWFWSRSRQELWHKGATSGNTQKVVSVTADCDEDAVVVRVLPQGPACHRNTPTCFEGPTGGALAELDAVLAERAAKMPEGSYSAKLLKDENLRIKKIGEESAELIHALLQGSDERAVEEAADVVYHVAVALRARGLSLARLQEELLKRAR
ncbi:MAG TPA: bifunctional phosphoribosyl-AMP cyclohydrolase/phosphoribosyl-ATP diphosphatase HisIE [Myxococcaceae bacterium]|nr:bifunctional phosphoribosyl-AMP cyclohydrolase/phosphoribosyl-ATP diphosphatase HisIE [Myxococcaceae bacterium]